MAERSPSAIVFHPEIACRFGDAIWFQRFRSAGFYPAGIQHERRTHKHSAAPVVPFRVLLGRRESGLVHKCDFPAKIDRIWITLLQFLPGWGGPKTPRRDNIEVISDGKAHTTYTSHMSHRSYRSHS